MSLVCDVLAHFESKIQKCFETISTIYVLNCFKCFLICFGTKCLEKKDNNNCQKNYIKSSCAGSFEIFSNIFFGQNISKSYTRKNLNDIKPKLV